MMKALFVALIFSSLSCLAQSEQELISEIEKFQAEQNEHYLDKETSPLKKKERRKFTGHNFYPIDLSFRVQAHFHKIAKPDTLVMPTSAGTEKSYLRYGELIFKIGGIPCKLIAYLRAVEDHGGYLFIPFKDETSGTETYGGGRYIDMKIPTEHHVVVDFNLAYNPYCAYTTGWFCPLPPEENTLKVAVKAGLKAPTEL